MPSFIEGFAKGFINERNRRLESEEKKEQRQFLVDQETTRFQREQEEREKDRQERKAEREADKAERAAERAEDFKRQDDRWAKEDAAEERRAARDNLWRRREAEAGREHDFKVQDRSFNNQTKLQQSEWTHQAGVVEKQNAHELQRDRTKAGLEQLKADRDKRVAKAEKERMLAEEAKTIATTLGDPNFAGTVYNERLAGVDAETIQKRYAAGEYQKNPNYKPPTKSFKIKTTPTAIDTGITDPRTISEAMVQDKSLLFENAPDEEVTSIKDTSGAYTYKPTNTIEVGSLDQALLDLNMAKQNGTPESISQAQMRVDSIKQAKVFESQVKGLENGHEPGKAYVIKDDKGWISSNTMLYGRLEKEGGATFLVNDDTGERVSVPDPTKLVSVNKDQNDVWIKASQRASDRYQKYNLKAAALSSTISTTQKMKAIADRNFHATTAAGTFAAMAVGLEQDVKGAFEMLDAQTAEADAAYNSGDMEAFAKARHNFNTTIEGIEKKMGKSVFSDKVVDVARDSLMFKALKKKATYDLAAATGITGNDTSNKDIQSFEAQLDGVDPVSLSANIDNANMSVINKLISEEAALSKDPEISLLAGQLGVKGIDGLMPTRIGELIAEPSARQYYDRLRRTVVEGQALAGAGAEGNTAQSNIPPAAIEHLKKNPNLKEAFEKKYKLAPGSADQYLTGE